MGCNYYQKVPAACSECGRKGHYELKHIGKASMGWCFILHIYPEEEINDLGDWMARFNNHPIEDEYGDAVSSEKMMKTITERASNRCFDKPYPPSYMSWEDFHNRNHSEPGPNGLLRAQLREDHVVKHGEGTWDCMIGDFS